MAEKDKAQEVEQVETAVSLEVTVYPESEEKQLVKTDEAMFYAPTSLKAKFLNASAEFVSSIHDDGTRVTQALIYNSMNNNDGSISDIEEARGEIVVANFMIYPVEVVNDNGEIVPAFRTVLITPEGKSFGSVATGVFNSLKSIVAIMGMPNTWETPLKLAPRRTKTRKGFYTLQLVMLTQ